MTTSLPLQLEHWPIERLRPYARNPRKNDHVVTQMAAVIAEFGFRLPIVVRSSGEVVDGHLRLKAAFHLGLETVPVVLADELTDAQIKGFRLLANRSATWAEWDDELLQLELAELAETEFDLALTGFDAAELEQLLQQAAAQDDSPAPAEVEDAADAVPEAEERIISQPGDLWLLGEHRLICGDAGSTAVVAQLMMGETAALCFTSPPYGQQRDYEGAIIDWDGLMRGVFQALPLAPAGQVLVNLGLIHEASEVVPYWDKWIDWMRTQGWRRFGWYVWDQGPALPGDWRGRLAPSFEFLFHFNREARKPNKIVPCKFAGQKEHLREDGTSAGGVRSRDGSRGEWNHENTPTQDFRIPDSVVRITRHKGKLGEGIDHPAVFPVALPQFVIEAYSDTGDVVYEPFSGSGTTLLAAQRTGRRCRAVEIAPKYVDVAVRRWQQQHANLTPRLAATGETFAEVAARRAPVEPGCEQ